MVVHERIIRLALITFGFIMGVLALEFGLREFSTPRAANYDHFHEPDKYVG